MIKKFEFLAFSSSQMWDNFVWMFAASGEVTAALIFWIRNLAKYAPD